MTSQSSLGPAVQEEVGPWAGSSTPLRAPPHPASRDSAGAGRQRKRGTAQTPAPGLRVQLGWVGIHGSAVRASPQGEGSRKLAPVQGRAGRHQGHLHVRWRRSRGLSVTAAGHAREADLLCVLRGLSRLGRWTEAPSQACEHPSPHSGQALSSVQKAKLLAQQESASSRTRPRKGLQRTAALPSGGSLADGRGSHRPGGDSSRFIRGLLGIRPREPHSQGVVTRGPAFFSFKRTCLVNTSNQKL